MYTDVLFFAFYAAVTELFLTASTIRTTPAMSKIPPITGKATSKPQDSCRLPNSYKMEKKRKERRIACDGLGIDFRKILKSKTKGLNFFFFVCKIIYHMPRKLTRSFRTHNFSKKIFQLS